MIAVVSREVAITYSRRQEWFSDPRREPPFKFRRECMKAEINGNGKCGAERDRGRLFWETACFMLKKNILKAGVPLVIFPLWWLRYELPSGRITKILLGRPLRLGNMTGVRYPPERGSCGPHYCSARDIRIYTPYVRTSKVARDTRSHGRLRNTRSSRHAGLKSTRVRHYPRIRKYLSSTHDFGFPISNVAEYSTSDG